MSCVSASKRSTVGLRMWSFFEVYLIEFSADKAGRYRGEDAPEILVNEYYVCPVTPL